MPLPLKERSSRCLKEIRLQTPHRFGRLLERRLSVLRRGKGGCRSKATMSPISIECTADARPSRKGHYIPSRHQRALVIRPRIVVQDNRTRLPRHFDLGHRPSRSTTSLGRWMGIATQHCVPIRSLANSVENGIGHKSLRSLNTGYARQRRSTVFRRVTGAI